MGFLVSEQFDWFNLLQSIGIVTSLLLSGAGFSLAIITYRAEKRGRQFANRIAMGENHRDLSFFESTTPALSRIRKTAVDLIKTPVTAIEENFIGQRIFHLARYFDGIEEGELQKLEKLEVDVRIFFSRPISQIVWKKEKIFHDERFVRFVEDCVKSE